MSHRLVLSLAGLLTAGCALGASALIVSDFVGEDGMRALWNGVAETLTPAPAPVSQTSGGSATPFKPTKEIHFFEQVPIEGTELLVSTGAAYPSIAAVEAEQPSSRWCYITLASGRPGVSERIDLGTQLGHAPPVYADASTFAATSLTDHGLGAQRLTLLARTHCRFAASGRQA